MKNKIGIKWKEVDVKSFLKNFLKKNKRALLYSLLAIIIIVLLIPPFTYLYFARDLKDKDSIMNRGKTGLTLLTRDNEPFFTFYQPKKIEYVSLDQIPLSVQNAVIASEDKNFYTNPGFSIKSIGRAFLANLIAGKVVQGGSTITQELAKNAFLSSNQNFLRKYQELVLATELNRRFSKKDILEMYLNSVYFGEGAFGIENASLAYFGKHAKDLTLSESSLLIGLLPAPSALSPLSNDPELALRKQEIILSEMVQDKYITEQEKNLALSKELIYNPIKKTDDNTLAPHFAIMIKNELIKKYGEERVIRDGFQVQTTLDQKKQIYAQTIVKNQVQNLRFNHATNGSAIAINPKNGEIEVMVGSYDFEDVKFGQTNMSISPRQSGSAFKPIIYADALERRLVTTATILQDIETTFSGNYKPKNYDKRFRGPVTLRRALANSLNIPAVEVMEKVEVPNGLNIAQKLGITTLGNDTSKYGLSLVLGSGEVKLLELTNAYAVFANNGIRNDPKSIISIKNKYDKAVDSEPFFSTFFNFFKKSQYRAISEEASFLISSILSDNNSRAESFGGSLTINRTAAVKTGTTEDYRDALTVGYTPSLVVGVWVGNNDNTPMDNVAGSLGAAPIWRDLMNNFLLNTKIETFQKPTFVVAQLFCLSSNIKYIEYFITGSQPASCEIPTPTLSPTPTPTLSPTPTPNDEKKNNGEKKDEEKTLTPTSTPEPTQIPTITLTITPTPTNPVAIPTL